MAEQQPPFRPPRAVPIPDEDPTPPRANVPDEAQSTPGTARPKRSGGPTRPATPPKTAEPQAGVWTLLHKGPIGGVELDGDEGAGSWVEFPEIELPKAQPLSIHFYQDTRAVPAIVIEPQPPAGIDRNFNVLANDEDEGAGVGVPMYGSMMLDVPHGSTTPELATVLKLSVNNNVNIPFNTKVTADDIEGATHVLVRWSGEEGVNQVRFEIGSFSHEDGATDDVDRIVFGFIGGVRVEGVDPWESEPDPQIAAVVIETPQPPLQHRPNAAVRARVVYSLGKLEDQVIECDWAGELQIMAQRLVVSRGPIRIDHAPDRPFYDYAVNISATVMARGSDRPALPPVLTNVPRATPTDGNFWKLRPNLARRVSLIVTLGRETLELLPLDAIFVQFMDSKEETICTVDAQTAREGLFGGEGLPLPNGTFAVKVTNKHDADVGLGLIWHLGA